MSMIDKAKGRAKKAAGDLTDDADLKRKGRLDERKGEAKDQLRDAETEADAKAQEIANLERKR